MIIINHQFLTEAEINLIGTGYNRNTDLILIMEEIADGI
jgi:hypothetical protein